MNSQSASGPHPRRGATGNPANRFEALQSGQIDLLLRNTSWTIGRDTTIGMSFSVPTFYDGQGVMVWTRERINDLQDLDGAVEIGRAHV